MELKKHDEDITFHELHLLNPIKKLQNPIVLTIPRRILEMALAALLLNQSILASVETVRERFDSFVEALQKFDQSAINFYGSDAEIIHLELSKDGLTRPNQLSGKQYQQILKKIWPMVRSNNDVWTFSDLEFDQKQDYVEITGKRYSHLRDATFPYVARFATNNEGKWVIIYEYLKTKELDQPTF